MYLCIYMPVYLCIHVSKHMCMCMCVCVCVHIGQLYGSWLRAESGERVKFSKVSSTVTVCRKDNRALTFENFILRIAYTFDITHGTYILYCILPIQFSQQEVHRIAWVFRRFRDFAKDAMLDNPRQLAEHIIRWKSSQINLLLRGLNELTIALTWMNFCQRVWPVWAASNSGRTFGAQTLWECALARSLLRRPSTSSTPLTPALLISSFPGTCSSGGGGWVGRGEGGVSSRRRVQWEFFACCSSSLARPGFENAKWLERCAEWHGWWWWLGFCPTDI